MDTKIHIRKDALSRRNDLSISDQIEKSEAIMNFLVNSKEFQEADLILLYKDYKNEVMTDGIFQRARLVNKTIAYPRVNGEDMDFYIVESKEQLKEGYKGIFEPDENCVIVNANDILSQNVLMILPGATFDKSGNRIGYGKGFYDRYLSKMPYIKTVALAYELQIADKIPSEVHDKQVEYVITEKEVMKCKDRGC